MSETGVPPASGMSGRTAATIENTIIGICIVALVLIFQPFNLYLFTAGCVMVVFGALAFNLVPLCEKGRPLRSLAVAAGIVVIALLVIVGPGDPLRLALRRLFHPAARIGSREPPEMPFIERQKILEKFREMVRARVPIVGGGAGTGLSAKCEEAGGIDLIIIYNSGRYRMAGRGSAAGLLAFGNANEIVKDMAREVLPVVKHTPVLAGVNGTDPFVLMPQFLAELKAMGFSGVQNFPTIGLFDGVMRASFEETGMGFGLEVDMIAQAHAIDLLTTPYVFNPDEARAMAKAGADVIVAHMGVTVGGSIGATSGKSLQDCVPLIDAIAEAALSVRDDVILLCHGGPIAMPADAEFILKACRHCHGFYGASSMERLPVEIALTEQTRRFKNIAF